jgi:aminoglycoside phosphotransferase family enzyme
MQIGELIVGLSRREAYPFPVEQVQVHQTHISVVFLAGAFAYKIKKPVKFSFVDFSSLDHRKHFCEEEVRLNRRLAPSVYLGVVPVTAAGQHKANSRVQLEGAGEPLEWAVKMERLPESATFQQRLVRGEISPAQVADLAVTVADFHRTVARSEAISAYGRFENVALNLRNIFIQSRQQVGTTLSAPVFARLDQLMEDALARLRPLIDERSRSGMTRDVHGDLHLDHIYLFPEKSKPADVVIVDCIEFNERFRFIDTVADTAFAVMDFPFTDAATWRVSSPTPTG